MAAREPYYEVLGLDAPPVDRKAVKRAYSKKLKVTRPEDDPSGFMRLRDAHDLALKILSSQIKPAPRDIQPMTVDVSYSSGVEPPPEPSLKPDLTYGDMLPEAEPQDDATYALGPTPNFDAPVSPSRPKETEVERLMKDVDWMLEQPARYNERDQWNTLFRKARQLDIDDYVDFEHALLDKILQFHDYFDFHPDHKTPEKMQQHFTMDIAASLFKTMNWDQVSKRGNHRRQQIEWLERRVRGRRRYVDPVPLPVTKTMNTGKLWLIIIGTFILTQVLFAWANS